MSDMTIYNYSYLPLIRPLKLVNLKNIPLGPLYIVSALRENGYNADFRDLQLLNSPKKENLLNFFENSSEIIGISGISPALPSLTLLVRELKKKHPEKTIILGGAGPTGIPEQILKACPADIVVMGEGEEIVVELMNCLEKNKDLKNVRGISYRDGNRIRSNPARPRIENLDDIPFPAYDKVDFNRYNFHVMTSRGCPYKCTFCYRAFLWRNEVKFRSVDNVIEEIKLIYEKYKKERIYIYDDIFTLDKKRVFEFCDKLKKEKIDIKWRCYGRVDLMNDEIMKKMSESGCDRILYGVESGSDKILKKIKKGFSAKQAEHIVIKSKKYFPDINAIFIWGFPFETMEDFKKTIRLADKFLKMEILVGLNNLRPEIGTQIYDDYKDNFVPYEFIREYYMNFEILFGHRNIYKIFKRHPSIIMEHYRFKTPNFLQKSKIVQSFRKKKNFYLNMKYGCL